MKMKFTFCILFVIFSVVSAVQKEVLPKRPKYNILFKNGRPKGGLVGHWNEDFRKGRPQNVPFKANANVQMQWFRQKLDHFNGFDTRTWMQKYWVNNQYYRPGGPVFILIGGEGPTSQHWIDTSQGTPDWLKNAQMFNALCFQLEHRYYGDSYPTSDTSTPNLQWLSSRQALADIANFIPAMAQMYNLPNTTKWVTFGGSYSGALSGWFRLKYPHMVVGAIATSAPVQAQVDFRDYFGVVTASLATYSQNCLSQVQLATTTINSLLQTMNGRQILQSKLNLCNPIDPNNMLDLENFWSNIAGNMAGVVQYSQDNRGIFANVLTIPNVCSMLTNPSVPDIMDRYAAVNNLILNAYGQSCFSFTYWDMIAQLQNTSIQSDSVDARMWTYQTCIEFGYYQDSDLPNQAFGHNFPLGFSLRQCADIFGSQFTPALIYSAVNETNLYYGGRNFKATNVVLPNGSVDPWHALGILTSPGQLTPAVYIMGTAHCANMYPAGSGDAPGLVAARQMITQQLGSWLN